MDWEVTYSYLVGMPTSIRTRDTGRNEQGGYSDLERQVKIMAGPGRVLEFDHYTDQVDVWCRRRDGRRRDRFLILMA